MVDPYQLILGIIALVIVVLAPIGFVLAYEGLAGRWDNLLQRWRERLEERRQHRRNVRALRKQTGVPIEKLAADLRRLRTAVGQDAHRSAAHQLGNRLAYDRVLIEVCEMLEIEHELDQNLLGMEQDIERVRIEAELERAGVVVGDDRHFGQAA
jgi:1-acyl-sn-glycerol-3-phosphate acyltransferase